MRRPLVARSAHAAALVAGALAASGCDLQGGTEGELGRGRFFYDCVAFDDPFCGDANPTRTFDPSAPDPVPTSIVLGATFDLDFDRETTDDDAAATGPISVTCALADCAERDHFRATREGWLGFVAETADGVAVDVIHVEVAAPTQIGFASGSRSVSGLDVDRPTLVTALPRGASGQMLFGGFQATWESSDTSVVVVQDGGAPAAPDGPNATLVPVGVGDATVIVTVAGVRQELPVSVREEVLP